MATVFNQVDGAGRVRVDVDEAALARMQQPGGQVNRYTRGLAGRVATKARQIVPVKTGTLRGSIRVEQNRSTLGRYESGYGVLAAAKYARFVHDGTKPHTIVPVRATVLAFNVGGATVFTRLVNHPGTKAQPFLLDAARVVVGGGR
jgi:hypothetical protein